MKTRQGFVSNSSTSSFFIYGMYIDSDKYREALEKHRLPGESEWQTEKRVLGDRGFSQYGSQEGSGTYVGICPSAIGDDETGAQFKARVLGGIRAIFGEGTYQLDYLEEAWYDG